MAYFFSLIGYIGIISFVIIYIILLLLFYIFYISYIKILKYINAHNYTLYINYDTAARLHKFFYFSKIKRPLFNSLDLKIHISITCIKYQNKTIFIIK